MKQKFQLKGKFLGVAITIAVIALGILFLHSWEEKRFQWPRIREVFVAPQVRLEYGRVDAYSLSPDGGRLIDALFYEYDLRTGMLLGRRFGEVQGLKYGWGGGGGYMGWSVDGRYFAATQIVYDEQGMVEDKPVVVIDTQTHTARYYPGPFRGWSGVNSDRLLIGASLLDRQTGRFLDLPEPSPDFQQGEVRGYGSLLWNVEQNVPVGVVTADPPYIGAEAEKARVQQRWLYIENWATREVRVPLYQEGRLERVVGWDFDPTGQFVLLMVWERSQLPEDRDEISGQYVVDTKLVVVDWRTEEQQELYRLSDVGDGQVVGIGWMSTWHWSADGSTIIIPRKDGSVVVLKVDYPSRHKLRR